MNLWRRMRRAEDDLRRLKHAVEGDDFVFSLPSRVAYLEKKLNAMAEALGLEICYPSNELKYIKKGKKCEP